MPLPTFLCRVRFSWNVRCGQFYLISRGHAVPIAYVHSIAVLSKHRLCQLTSVIRTYKMQGAHVSAICSLSLIIVNAAVQSLKLTQKNQ